MKQFRFTLMAVVAIAVLVLPACGGGGGPTSPPPFVEPPEPTPVGFSFEITSGPTPPAPAKGLIVHEDEISLDAKVCVDNTQEYPLGAVQFQLRLFDGNGKEVKSGAITPIPAWEPGCEINAHEFTRVAYRPGRVTMLKGVFVEPQTGKVLWQRKICDGCYGNAMIDYTWKKP